MRLWTRIVVCVGLSCLLEAVVAAKPTGAAAGGSDFLPLVGSWHAVAVNGKAGWESDGARFSSGQVAAGMNTAAGRLFKQQGPAFVQKVRSTAFFPLLIYAPLPSFTEGELSVHFKPLGGKVDRAAGLVFGLKATGDYYVLRANALENDVTLYRVTGGQPESVASTKAQALHQTWHELRLVVAGRVVTGSLDGQDVVHYELGEPAAGRVGLWTKTDSVVLFQGFTALTRPAVE